MSQDSAPQFRRRRDHAEAAPGPDLGAPAATATAPVQVDAETIARIGQLANAGTNAMNQVLDGKEGAVRLAWTVMLAGGHLLLEDVPGVGKTLLAKSLAAVTGGAVRRIQFTPDLLPSDVLGVNLFNQETRHFEFRPGPVFTNIVIGDEINRASPKTQSAMLECMAESQVSIDGITHRLPDPFMVVATQNPIDMEGTYVLPEAQRDRFMARVSLGYPAIESEIDMLDHHGSARPIDDVAPVCRPEDIARAVAAVRLITATRELRGYVVRILDATRSDDRIALGASPRAGLHLLRAAKAAAALAGRNYVTPEDVRALVVPVLGHRLLAHEEHGGEEVGPVLTELLHRVRVTGN